MHAARLAMIVVASMLLGGCVFPVWWGPGFYADSRGNIGDDGPTFIVVSQTTRQEVLLTLGEPDGEAPDGRWFSYGSAWTKGGGGVGVIVIAPAPAAGMAGGFLGSENVVFRRLIVRFDAHGTVSDSRFETQMCRQTSSAGFMVSGGADRGGASQTPSCLDIAATELRREQQLAGVVPSGESLPTYAGSWSSGWTSDRRRFMLGTVLITETALVFLPPRGAYGPLPKPVRIPFTDMAEVTFADFRTITRVTRRDGTRDSFLFLPAAVRDLVTQRARRP